MSIGVKEGCAFSLSHHQEWPNPDQRKVGIPQKEGFHRKVEPLSEETGKLRRSPGTDIGEADKFRLEDQLAMMGGRFSDEGTERVLSLPNPQGDPYRQKEGRGGGQPSPLAPVADPPPFFPRQLPLNLSAEKLRGMVPGDLPEPAGEGLLFREFRPAGLTPRQMASELSDQGRRESPLKKSREVLSTCLTVHLYPSLFLSGA